MHPLLTWGQANRRDLPWRRTRDPWSVLVSELMLQQTQVPRVLERYQPFLDRLPTLADCAAAPVGDVVRLWAGLGYNRRAVNLHRTAVAVVERHAGVLPADLSALLALPGIGPYTARAVLCFAFEQDVVPLDVNTSRPLARAFDLASQDAADALVPRGAGWEWGQSLMDLGALVCIRRSPACVECPLAADCRWHLAGHPSPDPAAPASRQSRFEGSDRQGRGRLLDALRRGPVPLDEVAAATGWPGDPIRAAHIAGTLVSDGLAVDRAGTLHLP